MLPNNTEESRSHPPHKDEEAQEKRSYPRFCCHLFPKLGVRRPCNGLKVALTCPLTLFSDQIISVWQSGNRGNIGFITFLSDDHKSTVVKELLTHHIRALFCHLNLNKPFVFIREDNLSSLHNFQTILLARFGS